MIEDFVKKYNLPKFRLTQFNQAFCRDLIPSFDELTTWPKDLREKLKAEIPFSTISPVKEIISLDKKTIKVLFSRLSDKKQFESVLIIHKDGRCTICVSCMIGCPLDCIFCATGKMGFLGNLSQKEIVDQVLYFARLLKEKKKTITNIVFMGMGEPLLNLDAVLPAIKIFTDPNCFGMSNRRIAISTAGIIPGLRELIASGFKGRLVLSLHAPEQKLREELMPVSKKYFLTELMVILKDYAKMSNKRINFEYIMINKINDQPQHARDLAKLLGRKLSFVNLIPFNPVLGVPLEKSKPQAIKEFSKILTKCGIHHTIRVTMGDDIQAACGQLTNSSET